MAYFKKKLRNKFVLIDDMLNPGAVAHPLYSFFYHADKNERMQLAGFNYLSPAQMKGLSENKRYPAHESFKTDIFVLGMIAIYCLD